MATTVQQVVDVFLASVKAAKKPNTLKQYSARLRPFALHFADREFASLGPLEIEQYLIDAGHFPDGRQKAPDTRRINAIAILQLQQFALDKKVIPTKIVEKLKKPTGRKRDRLPTPDETAQILAHASPAFRLIYQALRQSGARPNELARATLADWDQSAGMITLADHKTAEKTGKPRRIPVGDQFRKILDQASVRRKPDGDPPAANVSDNHPAYAGRSPGATGSASAHLFVGPRGTPWTSANLTQTFTRLRKRAGLPPDLVLYLARHEHATAICKAKDIHAAKEALGHANIATTQRYVHTDDAQLKANQDLFVSALPLTKGEVGGGPFRAKYRPTSYPIDSRSQLWSSEFGPVPTRSASGIEAGAGTTGLD